MFRAKKQQPKLNILTLLMAGAAATHSLLLQSDNLKCGKICARRKDEQVDRVSE